MEYQKITNLLGNIPDKVPRFITKKWIEVHHQSGGSYNTSKQIRFKTSKHPVCVITISNILETSRGDNNRDRKNRDFVLKNDAPFISCISKISSILIENAEDVDVVMPVYNLLEYSKNYSKTSGSLWNYYKDELTNEEPDDNGPNKNVINSKSFKYKTSITGSTYNVNDDDPAYNANKSGKKS